MKSLGYLAAALITVMALSGGQALANTCRAETLTCPTAMPTGGFCECTSHGTTQAGTVTMPAPHEQSNSTAGGCGANPAAPGCR
jgi:hypothetical protein